MPSICVQIVLNHCIWHICAMLQQILTKLSWYSIHPLYLIVLFEVTSILRECYMYYMYHSCQMDDILLQRSFQADSWLSRHGVGSVWTCQSWHCLATHISGPMVLQGKGLSALFQQCHNRFKYAVYYALFLSDGLMSFCRSPYRI